MSPEGFITLVFAGSFAAGCLGALTGLGGGVVVVPMLILGFGIDPRYAVGASLIAVIATSCGSAPSYLRRGLVNTRVAVILELATVLGALGGAFLAGLLEPRVIVLIFCAVLFYSAWSSLRAPTTTTTSAPKPTSPPDDGGTPIETLADRLGLASTAPGPSGPEPYRVHRVIPAFGVMTLAGMISALTGVGGGVVKVLAMDRLMRMPFRASTATSNLMIGVTASASAGVYLARGQVAPDLAAPVALGALAGSVLGARLLARIRTRTLRVVFALTVAASGVQLLLKALRGEIAP
ncbi:MAG: sulfite exporter TauE/SafE family protein [Phycisphaeraceae bacterium]|nr:MAG: sulfite exporter TauE/SafE family protein [Phycisphaeraceae bacterium]